MSNKSFLKKTEHLFSFLLFFVFLLCSAFTILIGSRVYENIHARDDIAFETTTALSYITNKVRQNDTAGAITLRNDGETEILVLTSVFDKQKYETWIYQMDGGLYELFTAADSGLDITAGQKIMDGGPVSFSIDDSSLLTVSLDETGQCAHILLRSNAKEGMTK